MVSSLCVYICSACLKYKEKSHSKFMHMVIFESNILILFKKKEIEIVHYILYNVVNQSMSTILKSIQYIWDMQAII